MTDAVLIDLAVKEAPGIEVVFIDTGYHFPETLETVERVRRRYGLNLRIMTVATQEPALWEADPENCCSAVKVGQLDRALADKDAWLSGLRRSRGPDPGRCADRRPRPARAWSRSTRWRPGPTSTCAATSPTTTCRPIRSSSRATCRSGACPAPDPVAARARIPAPGRWAGLDKTECGLHD